MKQLVICLLLLASTTAAYAQAGVSALVETVPLQQRSMANRISGYGTLMPEPGAVMNLNLPRAGRITELLVTAGQKVRKGDPLLILGPDPEGRMNYKQAQNAVTFARNELNRTKSLLSKQLATRSQVDSAQKALRDALESLKVQSTLGNGKQSSTLTAPFSGLVMSVAVAQGDRVQPGAPLMQLSRTDFMQVRIGIEPGDSQNLRPGMDAQIASVFDPSKAVAGKVVQIDGQIDPATQLMQVTIRVPGVGFLPGSRVQGTIATNPHTAFAVPRSAVLRDNDGAYIFQVVGGKARRIAVHTGVEEGAWVEVAGKGLLKAPVVSTGNYELENGMTIRESRK